MGREYLRPGAEVQRRPEMERRVDLEQRARPIEDPGLEMRRDAAPLPRFAAPMRESAPTLEPTSAGYLAVSEPVRLEEPVAAQEAVPGPVITMQRPNPPQGQSSAQPLLRSTAPALENGARTLPDRLAPPPAVDDGQADRGATGPQLRRFIKSRAYVPMHELRRRFAINGQDDEVTPVDLEQRRVFVGLPDREGRLLAELLRGGDIGYELSMDPITPIVVGVYPMRPVTRP